MANINDRLLGMTVMGKFFGYPECCIDFFLDRSKLILKGNFKEAEDMLSEKQLKLRTGFIPCNKCLDSVEVGEEGSLIKDRICSLPYPEDNYKEEELNNFAFTLGLKQL